jgi:hypothetical protein
MKFAIILLYLIIFLNQLKRKVFNIMLKYIFFLKSENFNKSLTFI